MWDNIKEVLGVNYLKGGDVEDDKEEEEANEEGEEEEKTRRRGEVSSAT